MQDIYELKGLPCCLVCIKMGSCKTARAKQVLRDDCPLYKKAPISVIESRRDMIKKFGPLVISSLLKTDVAKIIPTNLLMEETKMEIGQDWPSMDELKKIVAKYQEEEKEFPALMVNAQKDFETQGLKGDDLSAALTEAEKDLHTKVADKSYKEIRGRIISSLGKTFIDSIFRAQSTESLLECWDKYLKESGYYDAPPEQQDEPAKPKPTAKTAPDAKTQARARTAPAKGTSEEKPKAKPKTEAKPKPIAAKKKGNGKSDEASIDEAVSLDFEVYFDKKLAQQTEILQGNLDELAAQNKELREAVMDILRLQLSGCSIPGDVDTIIERARSLFPLGSAREGK